MEISKLKDQGILVKTKDVTFAIDPLLNPDKLPEEVESCDFILSTQPEHKKEKFGDGKRVFSWPGEYEVKGVAVHAKPGNGYNNEHKSPLFFILFTEEGKYGYLPALEKEISPEMIESIGDLDLLMFPSVGDEKFWHNTIESIEPKSILPIEQAEGGISMDTLLAKIGVEKPEAQNKITIKNKSDFNEEKMIAFLLA
jgi:Beta-lactamase superfamily domain